MSVIIETGLLFTYDEIRVLLYGMGVREVEGVYMGEKTLTEQDVISVLHRLSDRGIIIAEEKEFVAREDVKAMVQIMGYPEGTFVWRPEHPGGPQFYCYAVPGKVVVSEPYWRKKDMLKLRMFTTEAFEEWKEQIENDYRGY